MLLKAGRHFNCRQPSGLISIFQVRDESSSGELGGRAYAKDKNTSARLCAKNAGGAYTMVCPKGGSQSIVLMQLNVTQHNESFLPFPLCDCFN